MCKYGKRVDNAQLPEKYLRSTTLKDGFQTCTYQAQLLHEDFPVPLNVVIIVNFRDAKQFWGLEDFMNINLTAVTNTANLSLFMVNLSQLLMCDFRQTDPDFGVLDLKSYYRGYRYVTEMLKNASDKPDDIFVAQLFRNIPALGSIHIAKEPVSSG